MQGVESNGKRLREGSQLPGHALGNGDQHICGMDKVLGHTAVHMNAQDLQILAAVGALEGAGIAVTAVEVGVYDHTVAHLQPLGVIVVDLHDLAGQLMADDPGIADQVVHTPVSTDIGTADTCGLDLQQRHTLLTDGHLALGNIDVLRLLQIDNFHDV